MTDDHPFTRREIPRSEQVAYHLSRAKVMQDTVAVLTDAEIAAKATQDAKTMAMHDYLFGREFISLGGALPISRKLAKNLGYNVEPADNETGDMGV